MTGAVSAAATPSPPQQSALRQPRFVRYLGGFTVDMIGDQIWFIALTWAAARAADADTAAMVVAAGTVPRLFLLLPAGVLIDRVGALRVAQAAQVLRMAAMLAALAVSVTQPGNVALLIVLALTFGIGDAARLPAAGALPPFLLPIHELPRGQGLVATAGRVTSVLAGPAAGAALALGGFTAAVGINFALCCIGFVAFLTLGRIPASRGGPATEKPTLLTGLTYVIRHRHIVLMLLVVTALNLALAGPLNLGLVLRSEEQHWGPQALGILFGVFGATAATGALTLVRFRPRRRPAMVGLAWCALSALGIAALGYAPNFFSAIAAVAMSGLALGPAGALLIGLVQAATSPDYLGRVMSLITFSTFGLTPLALTGFGFLAKQTGTSAAFLIAGTSVILCCLAGAAVPSLRGLRLPQPSTKPGETS